MTFGLAQGFLLGTLFEAIFYGAYAIVFTQHMRILYRRRSGTWSHIYCQVTSYTLFLLVTMSLVLGITRCVQAFTKELNTPAFATTYFEAFDSVTSEARTSAYMAATIVSDLFLVYRCFIIWGHSYLIALPPFLLLLVDLAFAIWTTTSIRMSSTLVVEFAASPVGQRTKFVFIVSLVLNLSCTTLIAFRLWSVQRQITRYTVGLNRERSLSRIITIMVESAAIYSALLVALITTDVAASNSFFVIFDALPPIIGISFSMIIVRSETKKPPEETTPTIKFGSHSASLETAESGLSGVQTQTESISYPPSLHSQDR